jgi:hypothetical protein
MAYQTRRVAVLGAGTMGVAIAAHAANAGLVVDLLDIATPGAQGKERNSTVQARFERMLKASPAALMDPGLAEHIRLGNFEDNFERLGEADWILEAIIEKLEPKRELMARVQQVAKPGAIIASNTSGIPLSQIAQGFPEDFKRRFLGMHFFNPPRYLKLLEIIPTPDTDPQVVEAARRFGAHTLGKGVVIAKDIPNFIGNRVGGYSGMQAIKYALNAALAKLKPVFKVGGTVTAGNSSQRSDGAAAVVVMERKRAEELGLEPKLRFIGFTVAGVRPEVMGIGPLYAVPKVLKLTGLSLEDIDLIEFNEAFASQVLAVTRGLGLDLKKVNVNGGAIALGHPMGATGTKLTVQLMHEMKRRKSRYGMVTMCIGGGQGAAGIFENLQS